MFEPEEINQLREVIRERTHTDAKLLTELRQEVIILKSQVKVIQPRSTTSVSLVSSDGGNNKLVFDPFYLQLVRVMDSYGKQLCLDAISPSTDTDELSAAQFDKSGGPITALGRMMKDLGVRDNKLSNLSSMVPTGEKCRNKPDEISNSWVLVYRDLVEWAALYERICYTKFSTSTLIVRDGQLRSKLFQGELFIKLKDLFKAAIEKIKKEDKLDVYLVGLAKRSKVLERYKLAMDIEDILSPIQPVYVKIPTDMQAKAYVWPEYARGDGEQGSKGELPKFVIGEMFFVRFGGRSGDPIWIVDLFSSQATRAAEIFGFLLADAINGFPVPLYPRCLQKAHEYAELAGFDIDIMQDALLAAVRTELPERKRHTLDHSQFQQDYSSLRYS